MKKILLTVALLAVAIAGQACTNFIVGKKLVPMVPYFVHTMPTIMACS